MRVIHYYPRALVGDGGITNAVKKLSRGMINAGAQVVLAYDSGVDPPAHTDVSWVPVRHRGRAGMRVPVGLERALDGADLLILHSAWTLHNARAAAVARRLAVHVFFEEERAHLSQLGYRGPTVVAPNGVEPPEGVSWDGGSGGYVMWMGRFDPEHKGLDVLIEGVGTMAEDERPQVRLHGPDWRGRKQDVSDMVARLGLGHWVSVREPIHGETKWDT